MHTSKGTAGHSSTNATPPSDRVHLPFLDGIRGLAALFVLISHLHFQVNQAAVLGKHSLGSIPLSNSNWIENGRDAVSVFIVLSGFSLMLPMAVAHTEELRGGTVPYLRRRAKRIMPAYFATLVLSTILTLLSHRLKSSFGIAKDNVWAENLSPGALLSHLFLVHNFSSRWIYTVEPALWSVAVEWQIYFFLPLLLLPVLRRFGVVASVLVMFVVGFAPHLLLPAKYNLDWSAPWFLGLFALGCLGAMVTFWPRFVTIRAKVPWAVVALMLLLVTYLGFGFIAHQRSNQPLMDVGVGLTTVCVLIYCSSESGSRSLLSRLLSSSPCIWLGAMSYSLYLTHGLVITRLRTAFAVRPMPDTVFWVLMWTLGIGLPILFGFVFHLLFERPFLSRSQRRNLPITVQT